MNLNPKRDCLPTQLVIATRSHDLNDAGNGGKMQPGRCGGDDDEKEVSSTTVNEDVGACARALLGWAG